MLLKLASRIFKMSQPPKRIKVHIKRSNIFGSDEQSLKKLSQEELIQKVIKLEEQNFHLKNIINKSKEEFHSKSSQKTNIKIDFDLVPKRHVFLKFYYLGWDYQGFVVQEYTGNTIEDYVLRALQKCALIESREKCNYQKCGRTDKGVSAFSQVISLDLRSKLSEPAQDNVKDEYPYCAMLNRLLPESIKCYAWAHVSSEMSARFNCSFREYKYYFPKGDLDIELMQTGAKYLLGTHDFRNFCKMDVGNGVTAFTRKIEFVDIRPSQSAGKETSGYQIFEFVIRGNAFLLHQIRCIMSILLLIGQKKESPDVVKRLLDIEENPSKPQYSPAKSLPLNLFHAEYEGFVDKWNTDESSLSKVIKLLQNQWIEHKIKCTMIKDMVENLDKEDRSSRIYESLMIDVKRKSYQPLFTRGKCMYTGMWKSHLLS